MTIPAGAIRVLRKEIREALRDRNLVVNLILVPLFLYPLLGFAVLQVFLVVAGIAEREVTIVSVGSAVPAGVTDRLRERERFEVVAPPPGLRDEGAGHPTAEAFRDARAVRIESGEPAPDAHVAWMPGRVSGAPGDSALVYHDRSRDRSVAAKEAILEDLRDWEREKAVAVLVEKGLEESDFDLWSLSEESTASASQRGKEILSRALPIILLIMLATGAVYSAVDTVVGERERETLETILTAPLARGQLVLGKFLFVLTASVTTLVLNLASLTLFFGFLLRLMGAGDEIRVEIDPLALLVILLTAVLTAGFLSALLMLLVTPARTYREGQAALTPVFLAILVPGLVVSVSREAFGWQQALIPVLNATALFESALRGELPPGPIAITLAVLATLSVLAVAFAARIIGREEIYFSPRLRLRDVFFGPRRVE